jgi:hypothetical protein
MPPELDASLELIHRIVGYPLAFVVAPIALASFAGARGHRWSGIAFAILMTFLYVTGTAFTLTRHPWWTWEFGRNIVFNLLGYSFVLHGFRAMWLMLHPEAARATWLDRALLAQLVATVAVMAVLAVPRSTPLRMFAVIGIGLVAAEIRDRRRGMTPALLYARHVRYMLASYFYVLTVVSLVHLKDRLSSDARWMWPGAIGLIVIWFAGGPTLAALRPRQARARRLAVFTTLGVTLLFGVYVAVRLADGTPITGQMERRPPSAAIP